MKKVSRFVITIGMVMLLLMPSFVEAAQVHRVASGETLFQIAQRHGITVKELIAQNGYLRNPNSIHIGQVLIVPKEQETNVHTVRQGDTLYKISKELGIPMATLASENGITNWNHLSVGQKLTIPATNGTLSVAARSTSANAYVVKVGDTLYKISQSLGISMAALAEYNNLEDWNTLYVGQKIKLPTEIQSPEKPKESVRDFQYTTAQLVKMYPDTIYLKGSTNTNKIALTFDDGPNVEYTPQVLEVLKQHKVPATFFVMGNRAEKYPEIVQRIVREGHVIGNHTWIHPDLRKVSQSRLINEIQQTEDVIHRFTGLRMGLMRPPYGELSQETIEELKNMKYKAINWSVDSVDWRDKDVDQILINSLPSVRQGGILLFHDSSGENQSRAATVEALPELIYTLKMQGYEFVTIDELLNIPAYK